jgi:hypothetical protein
MMRIPGVMPMEETNFLATSLEDKGSVHNSLAVGAGEKSHKEVCGRRVDFNLHCLSADLKLNPESRHQIRMRHSALHTLRMFAMRAW